MFFRGLTEEDKEFIKEATKTDLQREKEKTEKSNREKNELFFENEELKKEIIVLIRTLNETYKYFERNNYEIPIMIDEPKLRPYTSKIIEPDFVRMINIPVANIVKEEMEDKINKFYGKYKKEIEKSDK